MSWPAAFAAASTAAVPPRTIRSASDTWAPPLPLNAPWISSSLAITGPTPDWTLTSQLACGSRRMRAPLAPPRKSVRRYVEAEAHAVFTSCSMVRPESRIVDLSSAISASPISAPSWAGTLSCHTSSSLGDLRADVADGRAHVAVQQLEPGPGERVGELIGVLVVALGDLEVRRIGDHRHVGGRHGRLGLRRAGRHRRDHEAFLDLTGLPLLWRRRATDQLPLVGEERLEVLVVPLGGGRGPGTLEAGGDGELAHAGLVGVDPAETLLGEAGALGLGARRPRRGRCRASCRRCGRRRSARRSPRRSSPCGRTSRGCPAPRPTRRRRRWVPRG